MPVVSNTISVSSFFLEVARFLFPVEEIPEKKKAAIGVRAMKLSAKDHLEEVYALADGEERNILYKEKEVALQKLKNGSRDQKGTKIRV